MDDEYRRRPSTWCHILHLACHCLSLGVSLMARISLLSPCGVGSPNRAGAWAQRGWGHITLITASWRSPLRLIATSSEAAGILDRPHGSVVLRACRRTRRWYGECELDVPHLVVASVNLFKHVAWSWSWALKPQGIPDVEQDAGQHAAVARVDPGAPQISGEESS